MHHVHTDTPATHSRLYAALTLLVLALGLSACAIRPEPIPLEEHQARVAADRQTLYEGQEPLTEPLSLEMAIARALRYNYDHRLAVMEAAYHDQQLTAATYAMLPKLAANAGYVHRENEAASSSISYETRRETLEPSVSSEKVRRTADLTLTWTLLDFGLSYFQAKQQADRLLIMQERKRRVVNNMVKEVISAYWRAQTADKLLPMIDETLANAEQALKNYQQIHENLLSPPLTTLEQHKDLLVIVNRLKRIQGELLLARINLAALINIPLDSEFSIQPPAEFMLTPPPLVAPLAELEDKGLALRPDLREEAYQERIDKAEVYKEVVRMLPGVSLFAGYSHDANRFLVHNDWSEIGARATMNLFGLITGPMQISAAETKVDVTKTRRLAQTVAALVQINLAYHQYEQALESYAATCEINDLEERIYSIAQSEYSASVRHGLDLVRHGVSAVNAHIEHDRGLSDMYQYWGNLYFSLGGDIIPMYFEDESLSAMADVIREHMASWWKGELPFE